MKTPEWLFDSVTTVGSVGTNGSVCNKYATAITGAKVLHC